MQLSSLMVDFKTAWVEYPGLDGLEFELANLSRSQLTALRKRCVNTGFDKKTRQPTEILNEEKFIREFSNATIKNWKGFKLEYLEYFLPVDISNVDVSKELDYSKENAELLLTNSSEFDTWVNETVFDLENFRTRRDGETVEETGSVE